MIIYFIIFTYLTFDICYGTKDPHILPDRNVMVHLFEWKWIDIAKECEKFLSKKGFGAIQISPPNEHSVIEQPYRPWFERYQPVSYNLTTRSGNEDEFIDMVQRCNAVDVRIYVDAVINHMADRHGIGSSGSEYNGIFRRFPTIPYGPTDFNDGLCKTSSGRIESYDDPEQVRDCSLLGMPDLATGNTYVRQRIIHFFNKLIKIGIAGFRIDAAKHIWPSDIEFIVNQLDNLREDIFGKDKRPFIYQEVIDLGYEPIKNEHYKHIGRVTEFKYGFNLAHVLRKYDGQLLKYLRNYGEEWNFLNDGDAVVFIDNHDNQRGHGSSGPIITFQEKKLYKIATSFMLAWPYGYAQIMSSYNFDDPSQGPPTNPNGNTHDVMILFDGSCGNGWICEHRWKSITNMVKFRNIAAKEPVENWWDNDSHQIAFSRGDKAFFAINNDDSILNATIKTNLQPGVYCDIISGEKRGKYCTGIKIKVQLDNTIKLLIPNNQETPVIAIHIESKI